MINYHIFIVTAILGVILFVSILILVIYCLILFIKFSNLGIVAFKIYIKKNNDLDISITKDKSQS